MNKTDERFEQFTTAVSRAYKSLQKIKTAETERMGLKGSHVMCLYYLGKNPDGLTAAQLCRLCNEDKAAISRTIGDLTGSGYIAGGGQTAASRYRARLILTESGREKTRQLWQAIVAAVEHASEGFNDEERACFYRVFFTITDNLEKYAKGKERTE